MYTTPTTNPPVAPSESEAYQRARQRVARLRGFYSNLFIYIVINAILAVLNLLTDPSYLWFLWVVGGWGLAVALHAYNTFAHSAVFGARWEERKIREFMERERS